MFLGQTRDDNAWQTQQKPMKSYNREQIDPQKLKGLSKHIVSIFFS